MPQAKDSPRTGPRSATTDAYQHPCPSHQQLDVSSVAGLTVPDGSTHCKIQVLTQNVRYLDDGADPTTSDGMQLAAGKEMIYVGDMSALRILEETGTAEVNILYYRW